AARETDDERENKQRASHVCKIPSHYDNATQTLKARSLIDVLRCLLSVVCFNFDFCYSSRPMALFTKETPPPRPQLRPNEGQPAFDGTFLGPNVVMEGTVTGSEAVFIEGTVKG